MENKDKNVEKSSESVFVRFFKCLGRYFKNLGIDFVTSFKYNNMKLPGLLVCVPGVFLGFFLVFHAPVVKSITFQSLAYESGYYKDITFDPTAILLFILILAGILNIFTGVSMMGKKNLGSVVLATITSSVILIVGVVYIIYLMIFVSGVTSEAIKLAGGAGVVNTNFIMSIASVIVSILASFAGIIIGFIRYDRTYEKVDR